MREPTSPPSPSKKSKSEQIKQPDIWWTYKKCKVTMHKYSKLFWRLYNFLHTSFRKSLYCRLFNIYNLKLNYRDASAITLFLIIINQLRASRNGMTDGPASNVKKILFTNLCGYFSENDIPGHLSCRLKPAF